MTSQSEDAPAQCGGTPSTASRQVNWLEVYRYAERLARGRGVELDHRLVAGTPRWCGMPDDDARKLLALLLGGVREALSHDDHQAAMADTSREVSCAADWSAVARQIRNGRGAAYIKREGAA